MGKDEVNPSRLPRRRVVYAWNYRNWGGAQIYFASLIREAKQYFDVSVLMPAGSDDQIVENFRALGVEILYLDGQTDIRFENSLAGKIRQHFRKIKAELSIVRQVSKRFDPAETVLHVDLGFWSSLSVLLRLSSKFHVFFTIHTPLNPRSTVRTALWKLKGKIAGRAERLHFLASNKAAAQSLKSFVPRVAAEGVTVAYSGVDADEIESVLETKGSRPHVRSRIGVSDEDQLIILVGQFINRKGADVLIDALPMLARRAPRARIAWLTMKAPDGELAESAREAADNFPFRVHIGDEVGGRRGVMELQSAADLFLLPSMEEGLPIALVEAMALGTSCIASDVGAVAEAVIDGVTGVLVTAGDARELADAIIELLGDQDRRRKLSRNAKQFAMDKFDTKLASRITVEEYLKYH